ncbi:carbohydrate-binding protein [Apiospora sp. TS-2023a]
MCIRAGRARRAENGEDGDSQRRFPRTKVKGQIYSNVSCVSWGDRHIAVFGRGTANSLKTRSFKEPGGWSEWEDLGGRFMGNVTAVSRAAGRLDVFQAWVSLGGKTPHNPAAVSWGAERIDLFIRDASTNACLHKWWTPNGWSDGWENLGGLITSDLAVVSPTKNEISVFGLRERNDIYHKRWAGGRWLDWKALEVRSVSAPLACAPPSRRRGDWRRFYSRCECPALGGC